MNAFQNMINTDFLYWDVNMQMGIPVNFRWLTALIWTTQMNFIQECRISFNNKNNCFWHAFVFLDFSIPSYRYFLTSHLWLICVHRAGRDHVTRSQAGFHLGIQLVLQADLNCARCGRTIFDYENRVFARRSFMQRFDRHKHGIICLRMDDWLMFLPCG